MTSQGLIVDYIRVWKATRLVSIADACFLVNIITNLLTPCAPACGNTFKALILLLPPWLVAFRLGLQASIYFHHT